MCVAEENGWRMGGCWLDLVALPIICFAGQIAYLSTGLLSPLLLAVNSASIWTICYITVQRHKAILRPLSCLHPPSHQYLPLLLISFAALAFNGSKWAEFYWYWIEIDIAEEEILRVEMNITGNHLKWFLAHNASELALNESYRRIVSYHPARPSFQKSSLDGQHPLPTISLWRSPAATFSIEFSNSNSYFLEKSHF
ncbi:hypothetical protein WR25_19498 isoform C [Diploscapter pachys]|uniref:Uncharacterized protein n=1 Tax=Diploscapter pachys TaxID=2018661 RepID=A0A2A2K0J5_9BILA|nr:hypothetical protein WR25_19498 isoform A [Diploscapter pachys]PAV67462.1 hypothetical protein WR25_19498 isoform B [Diploscapter pachys]PAV67463.1 hypothetical protein WR25_19498 isoform C [Diploscapter pachys]